MGNQNNTLEGHLNSFKDLKAQELAAAWIINKRELSKPLSTITTAFPTYSLHDGSHSQTIIETIERLLGNNIRKLSATDTFMLLMAAYTHDLGMYLSYKTIEDKWKTKDFAKKINELENHRDPQIAKAAKLLRETQEKFNTTANNTSNGTLLWALEVKNAVTLLTIELFRGEHAKRSEDYLNNDSEFAKLLANIDQYGGLRSTLAKIAYLHCEDFNKVFILDKEANGYTGAGDMCHPRFVACMIRLGDLLDFDNNRFNNFALAMVKEVPETSLVHYKKHLSTGDETSLISPNEIRVSFNCQQDDVYREAAKWKKMVEQELYNMHAFWPEIVPEELSGNGRNGFRLPSAKQINIKLKYQGKENPNPDLMHLRFDISSKKTFEMLKGGAIYKDPGRVFLREIVQNALDATKLQIWQDMDIHLPFDLENPKRHIGNREEIRFFSDIPVSVYNKYHVRLDVDYDKKTQSIIVICEDCGTGISDESLIRMTSQVGESRKADKDYEKTIKAMPYFLQPTAAFGLGLQTVFYVTDEFTMETRCPGEKARRIVFRTSTNGSYCSIVNENIEFQRTVAGTDQKRDVPHGTTIKIVIDKEHLDRLFELDEKEYKKLINSHASLGYLIPASIDRFARDTFTSIEDIPFRYHSPYNSFETHNSFEIIKDEEKSEFLKEEGDFRLYVRLDKKWNQCKFWLEERKYGSHMEIEFHSWFKGDPDPTSIMLRNIPVTEERWWWGNYAFIKWNLCCREADKQVNLSRDGLLPQGASWCLETMNELLPACIQLTHKFLLKRYQSSKREVKDHLLDHYGALCLLNWHLLQPIKVNLAPLKEHFTPHAKDNDGNPVNTKQVIDSKGLVVVKCSMKHFKKTIIENSSKSYKIYYEIIISYNYFQDNELIINDEVSIPDTYICSEIFFVQDQYNGNSSCYRLVKESPSDGLQWVTISNDDIINNDIEGDCIHAFKNYEEIVVSNDAPLLGYKPPFHGKCWIYPVRDNDMVIRRIRKELFNNRTEAESFLRDKGRMEDLVPDYIVELIQKYNVLKNKNLSKEEIYNAYIRLILDHKFGVEKPSKRKK